MAAAAGGSRCTPGSARTTCSRSALPRPIRTTSFPSIAVPILDPGLSGALDAAWALAEPLMPTGKPLDIQITATDNGLDVDVRGSGPLPAAMIATLSRVAEQHRLARLTRHGELVLMRNAADDHDRRGAGDPAAGLVPAGHRRRRGSAGGAGRRALQARQTYRRSVLRGRPVCAAAGGEIADFGLRQRCRRGRGAAEGRDGDLGTEAGQGRGPRPVPPSADAAGTARLRRGRVRSAAAGRAGASRSSLRPARFPWWSRCPATSRPSRATRGSWSTAATGSRA